MLKRAEASHTRDAAHTVREMSHCAIIERQQLAIA